MKLLSSSAAIRRVLKEISVKRIAVAFVGAGFAKYVSLRETDEIILSPTLGSNPKAIRNLMKPGGPQVYFLDSLHSKLYIGEFGVCLGSCNLSRRALGDGGSHEAAVFTGDERSIKSCNSLFSRYLVEARKNYPDSDSLLRRLAKLEVEHQRAIRAGAIQDEDTGDEAPVSLSEYPANPFRKIHIAWWAEYGLQLNEDRIKSAQPELAALDLKRHFASNTMCFRAGDELREGDWILCWKCTDEGLPVPRGSVRWMRTDYVVPNGTRDRDYPLLAAQAGQLKPDDVPFELTTTVKRAFRDLIAHESYRDLRPASANDRKWTLSSKERKVTALLKELKRAASFS